MFGVSFPELLVIFVIVLVVFGPDKLPEFAKTFGKVMGGLRKQTDALRREFYNSVYAPTQEIGREFREGAKQLRSVKEELSALGLPSQDDQCPQCQAGIAQESTQADDSKIDLSTTTPAKVDEKKKSEP